MSRIIYGGADHRPPARAAGLDHGVHEAGLRVRAALGEHHVVGGGGGESRPLRPGGVGGVVDGDDENMRKSRELGGVSADRCTRQCGDDDLEPCGVSLRLVVAENLANRRERIRRDDDRKLWSGRGRHGLNVSMDPMENPLSLRHYRS